MKKLLKLTTSALILLGLSFPSEAANFSITPDTSTNNGEVILAFRPSIIPRPKKGDLKIFMKGFRGRPFQISSNSSLLLDSDRLTHIVQSHHPDYWDGSKEKYQTSFKRGTTRRDIMRIIKAVIGHEDNKSKLIHNFRKRCQVTGTFQGIEYVLGMDELGRIGQLFPKHRDYKPDRLCLSPKTKSK